MFNCQAQDQSQIQVPNPSPKSKSQIQSPEDLYDLLWLNVYCQDLGLLSGPLKSKPKLIPTEFQGLTLSTPSLVLLFFYKE